MEVPLGSVAVPTSFAILGPTLLNTPTAPVVGALMSIAGGIYPEVTAPTSVTLVAGTTYAVNAPLYVSHTPTTIYSNTSTAPGSGMVGRAMELTDYTAIGGRRYVQTVLGSADTASVVVGTPKQGSLSAAGVGANTPAQPATFYHAAFIRGVAKPSGAGALQIAPNNVSADGSYALVEPNDTFAVGDIIMNIPAWPQTWTQNKDFTDIEDPFTTFAWHSAILTGGGITGSYEKVVNSNTDSQYSQLAGVITAPGLQIYSYSVAPGGTSATGTFYYNFGIPFNSALSSGQNVTLTGFPTSTFLNGQTGTITTGATTTSGITATVTGGTLTGVSTTTGYVVGNSLTCTGTGGTPGIIPPNNVISSIDVAGATIMLQFAATTNGTVTCTAQSPYFTLPLAAHAAVDPTTENGIIQVSLPSHLLPTWHEWDGPIGGLFLTKEYPQNLFELASATTWNRAQDHMGIVSTILNYQNTYGSITNCGLISGTLTLTGTFPVGGGYGYQPTQYVNLSGLTNCSALNGAPIQLTGVTSTTLTAHYNHADIPSVPDTGTAYTGGIQFGNKVNYYTPYGSIDLYGRGGFFRSLNVSGDIVVSGNAPTIAVGSAAGTGATATITGTNQAGVFNITVGSSPLTAGTILTVSFASDLSAPPHGCSVMARTASAAGQANSLYTTAPTASNWSVDIANGTLAGRDYLFMVVSLPIAVALL